MFAIMGFEKLNLAALHRRLAVQELRVLARDLEICEAVGTGLDSLGEIFLVFSSLPLPSLLFSSLPWSAFIIYVSFHTSGQFALYDLVQMNNANTVGCIIAIEREELKVRQG